jgi:hypothetical protein
VDLYVGGFVRVIAYAAVRLKELAREEAEAQRERLIAEGWAAPA